MSEPAFTPTGPLASATAVPEVRLEYRGFRTTESRREYTVRARLGREERDYVVAIPHAAFADRRVSLQDGPDICFQHLRRELSAGTLADLGWLEITDQELADYRAAQKTVSRRRQRARPAVPPTPDLVP